MNASHSGERGAPVGGVALVWDNLGPHHRDACRALGKVLGRDRVLAIEMFPSNAVHAWPSEPPDDYRRITLLRDHDRGRAGALSIASKIVRACRAGSVRDVFLCNYERPGIALAALALRIVGKRVYLMWDTKQDDRARLAWREALKRLVLLPYRGALVASDRTAAYSRALGINPGRIAAGYDTISFERVRRASQAASRPFADRPFVSVARFVPKKNHAMLLDAFARYRAMAAQPRKLVLCGTGPLEAGMRERVDALGLGKLVEFRGNLPSEEVARELSASLCLLLPSLEEQFGIVVLEAVALGIPVIASSRCGACDSFVRHGETGYIVEPHDTEALAQFMTRIGGDEMLWQAMREATWPLEQQGDAAQFARGVTQLVKP